MDKERKWLKIILWSYIIFCLIIAGLNFGYAPKATPEAAKVISWIWHIYENWIKTFYIIIASFLTWRILRRNKNKKQRLRQQNLLGFIVAALLIHILGPILLGNQELYFFVMPFPWTSLPLQLLVPESTFYQSRFPIWGAAGITTVLLFYLIVSLVVFIGTLLWGRRFQCSKICMFNGFAAEIFAPVIPLTGKKKVITPRKKRVLVWARVVFLLLGIIFFSWWLLFILGVQVPGSLSLVGNLETYKYMLGELLAAMFFWIVFLGRGYCYYCPLGTCLGLLSKAAGQQINTNQSECIACGQCSKVCPMSIDVKAAAVNKIPVKSSQCLGCGHCVDICPTSTLGYQTKFIKQIEKFYTKERQK